MKSILTFLAIIFFSTSFISAQEVEPIKSTVHKGNIYIYWGWNRGWYTNSDISFKGDNYDFILSNVIAKDRQSEFAWDPYFKISRLTIPQYNFRLGYFFWEKYELSFGVDHMKYVMQADNIVKINGQIDSTGTVYDGTYSDDDIELSNDFLMFEHTDGLNYLNFEIRRFDEIFKYKKVTLNLTEGFGAGALMPKTNATLMNNARNDEFHLAGYGLGAVVGLNFTFYKRFFIQSEFKAGYINMPDIRTTPDASDKASQDFFFTQLNVVFGFSINIPETRAKIEAK